MIKKNENEKSKNSQMKNKICATRRNFKKHNKIMYLI